MIRTEETPLPPRADGRGGVFNFTLMMSGCYDQTIACKIASYRMGKADGITVEDGSGIDAPKLELIHESLIVIGSHG